MTKRKLIIEPTVLLPPVVNLSKKEKRQRIKENKAKEKEAKLCIIERLKYLKSR